MIKLGFVSAVVEDLSFEATVDLAAELGYDCVEMLCWPVGKAERRYAGVTHVDVTRLDEKGVKEIRDYCDKKGVSISSLGYYPNYLEDTPQAPAYAEHFLKVIEASAKLGIGIATTFIGRDHTKSLEENFKLFERSGRRSSSTPSRRRSRSESRTVRCSSRVTNGPGERTWLSAPLSGGGCSR